MRMSKFYMPTLREVPSEAEIMSHKLLLRAGLMRKLVSGVYSFLPLGYRVLRKVEAVVREEMDHAGSQELLMSAIQPKEIWEASGRWEKYGPEMLRMKDRNGREFCLGPTHEEYFTALIKDEVRSYKQLPLNLYQIQTKYRDEKRPRFGLIRCREFLMKDAYSYDLDEEGLRVSYQQMWDAYIKVFDRLRLKYKVVGGDSGAMGGRIAHEFMALSDVGEGVIAFCEGCDYAATDEKAAVVYEVPAPAPEKAMEKVYTPNVKTIDALEDFMKLPRATFAKAILFDVQGEAVMALVPGDRELNEVKLHNYLGVAEHEMVMASDELIERVTGAKCGFSGPVGLKEKIRVIVDSRIPKIKNLTIGANETDHHFTNVNYGRDFEGEIVEDLLSVKEGDVCPKCGKPLSLQRGIEVGNIFQLGTKYSEALHATYLDENGKEQFFVMGSYGIGISRTIAAIVEQNHDEAGIIWPLVVAPYQVMLTVVNIADEGQVRMGELLYKSLREKGLEVLMDDRKERPGVKFNDRDLIGIPIRITVGKKSPEGLVEFSLRSKEGVEEISADMVLKRIEAAFASEGLKFRR